MISTYNVGDSIPLASLFVDRAGGSLTGSATMIVEIFRPADGYFLDWNDATFKASGWTTKQAALAEVSSSNAPGWYKKSSDWSTSGVAPGSYFVTYRDTSAAAGNPVQQDEIRLIDSPTSLVSGTASAGSANSITLAGASSTDGLYKRQNVAIVGGTGAGQVRPILHYVGSTKVATVGPAWTTNPDSTSRYSVTTSYNAIFVDCGLAQAGGASAITLVSTSSSTDDLYVGCEVMILSGTGAGQNRVISGYNGGTKVATVATAWSTQPDSTSAYALLPVGRAIAVSVLDKTGYSVSSIGTDVIDANAVKADAVTKIQAGLARSVPLPTPEVIEAGQTETVPIWFSYALNGTPVTGTPPQFFVDRVVAGVIQRLDWDSESFVDPSTTTAPSIAMDELDATHAPGAYYRLWDPAFPDNPAYPCVYFVTIKNGATVLASREIRVRTVDTINAVADAISSLATTAQLDAHAAAIKGAGFTAGQDDLHSARTFQATLAVPGSAMTLTVGERAAISNQVRADLITDHGAGQWVTASVAGLATTQNVVDAVAAIEAYGQLHWQTATAVNLNAGALTSTAIGGGFVNAIQANLALEATLTAMKGASFDGSTDSMHATRVLVSAIPTTAAPTATDIRDAVWAIADDGAEGTALGKLTLLHARQTGRRKMGLDGYELIYGPDNVTVIKKTLVKDIDGNIVVPGVGDPAEVSQEMDP